MNDNIYIENKYRYNILRAALDIKMAVDGSYDIDAESVKEIVDYLQSRIDNWSTFTFHCVPPNIPSNPNRQDIFVKRARFDSLVKQLCQEAISFYKGSWIEDIIKEREFSENEC